MVGRSLDLVDDYEPMAGWALKARAKHQKW
jgi:hypothetical protein